MKPSELLRVAWSLIADPTRWTQNAHARGADGNPCSTTSSHATCFCAMAALLKVAEKLYDREGEAKAAAYLLNAAWDVGGSSVIDVNDSTDHATVGRMYARAIELAEAAEVTW